MDAVEVRDLAGRPVAMMFPYPFPIASFPGDRGLERLRAAASAFRFPYIFVIALDRIQGWRSTESGPFFDQPSTEILSTYLSGPDQLSTAWVHTLASLARAWMADLQWAWRPRGRPAPGEDLLDSEFLGALRADEPQPVA